MIIKDGVGAYEEVIILASYVKSNVDLGDIKIKC